jgi:hypothetical protein
LLLRPRPLPLRPRHRRESDKIQHLCNKRTALRAANKAVRF